MGLIIFIVLVIAAVAVWRMRVPLLAKILGQPERRIERRLNRKR